ncbi:DUF2691 family protein [Bacillus cihuensis]|uniref:DUF2691 family protein n=1 Tax=Bacillus cihuensis TaxID=1208599 RepID=UPI0003F63817|nr:DUF2691 family protein [Bacillus cihuensis]
MQRGISFEIPNKRGTLLGDVLKPIDITTFCWRIGSGESYKVVNGQLNENLFSFETKVIEGAELKNLIENNIHYIISADLQAYRKGEFSDIRTYEEFIESTCELVLLVVDSCYVSIYCKNKELIEMLYMNASECRFKEIEYITDKNDTRTRLSVW